MPSSTVAAIVPGTYRVSLNALSGSRAGARLVATLRLIPFSQDSPRPSDHLAFGVLRGDLLRVGAPVCGDAYSATSADETAPGVLLTRSANGALELWIGSERNRYDPGLVTADGCGVILTVQALSTMGFSGTWGPAGIVTDGCGSYTAEKIE